MRDSIRLGLIIPAVLTGGTAASIGTAAAADIPLKASVKAVPVAIENWTGFYAGIHGGYGWGRDDHSFLPVPGITSAFQPNITGGAFNKAVRGGVFGGHMGYNQQFGAVVIGIEGSFDWTGLRGSTVDPFFPLVPSTATYDTRLNWIGTITPRLGFAASNWLLYVKGGLAAGQVESNLNNTRNGLPFGPQNFNEPNGHLGWTIGAGVEYALTGNWIAGLEYNYYDLGSQPYGGRPLVQYQLDLTYSALLARLSYKVGNGVAPSNVFAKAPPLTPSGVWTGLYAGLHGGYGWGKDDITFPFNGSAGAFALPAGGTIDQDIRSGLGGGHLGFNYQWDRVVIGLEGTFAASNFNATTIDPPGLAAAPAGRRFSAELKSIATITPRLGFAVNNWLLYAKAGLAAGEIRSTITSGIFDPSSLQEKTWHVGWTAGAGVEYAITRNWIAGLEYNYVDLGRENYGGWAVSAGVPLVSVGYNVGLSYSNVLARLSYKLDPPAIVARY